jgi:UDP-glucose 4-epimerase
MKKILITGANSYIGTSFKNWISKYPDKYSVDMISLRDDHWKEKSFERYNVVFHTAAIVHVRENDSTKYFKINRDLTLDVANKAKKEGVKHFIFLSTMGVYGTETGYIKEDTVPAPKSPYARSKYEAEKLLLKMNSNDFNVAILRPPLVYGKDCKGNYSRLAKIALKLPVIPDIKNKRSMIYVDNLSEFTRLLIDHSEGGLYFPQDKDYVNTTELLKIIAKAHGKNIKVTILLKWTVAIGVKFSKTFRKVFGSFVYDKEMQGGPGNMIIGEYINVPLSFEESIKYIEKS